MPPGPVAACRMPGHHWSHVAKLHCTHGQWPRQRGWRALGLLLPPDPAVKAWRHSNSISPCPALLLRLLTRACHLPTLLAVTCERACLGALMGDPPAMPRHAIACHCTPTDLVQERCPLDAGKGHECWSSSSSSSSEASGAAPWPASLHLQSLILSDDGASQFRLQGSIDLLPLHQCRQTGVAVEEGAQCAGAGSGWVGLLEAAAGLGRRQGRLLAEEAARRGWA